LFRRQGGAFLLEGGNSFGLRAGFDEKVASGNDSDYRYAAYEVEHHVSVG
jgi:hypothetical protein